jgi:hypothetical protein
MSRVDLAVALLKIDLRSDQRPGRAGPRSLTRSPAEPNLDDSAIGLARTAAPLQGSRLAFASALNAYPATCALALASAALMVASAAFHASGLMSASPAVLMKS